MMHPGQEVSSSVIDTPCGDDERAPETSSVVLNEISKATIGKYLDVVMEIARLPGEKAPGAMINKYYIILSNMCF